MYSYLKFIKQILLVGFIELLGILQTIIFLPVITKLLGVEDYGIWTQIKVTLSLLVPFTFLGLHEALVRFLPGEKNREKIQEGIYSSLVLVFLANLLIVILIFAFSDQLVYFLKFNSAFIKFLSLIVIFEALNTILLTVTRAFRDIWKYFWFAFLKLFGEIGLVVLAVFLGYGLYGAVISLLLIRVILFFVLSIYVLAKTGIKMPNFSLAKDYLSFGLPTAVDGISYWVITSVDRYFIGFFWGILFVGYYAPAYSLGTLLTAFLFPVAFMLSVVLPKAFDEDKIEEVKNYLSHSLKYFLLIAVPAGFGMSVLSKQLLLILSTKEIADSAHFIVPFISVSIIFYGISYFFSEVLILAKKTKTIALVWTVGALLNFILNIIFIPSFGILAAAITTLASYSLCLILMAYFSKKELKFNIDFIFMIKTILASVPMAILILFFNPQGFFHVCLSVLLGAVIYFILIFFFKGLGRKEIIFLENLIAPSVKG